MLNLENLELKSLEKQIYIKADDDRQIHFTMFQNEYLSEYDYKHCEFQNVLFENCILDHGLFDKCSFIDVEFRQCDLSNSSFKQTYFERVQLSDCKIMGADLSKSILYCHCR